MSRPIGVTSIAVLLFGFSLFVASRALAHADGQRNRTFLVAAGLLTLLAMVAAEALWSLRSHAFLAFALWGLCAIAVMALVQLKSPSGGHAVRAIPPLVYMGLLFAGAAIYLRRVV